MRSLLLTLQMLTIFGVISSYGQVPDRGAKGPTLERNPYKGTILKSIPPYVPRQLVINTKDPKYAENIAVLKKLIDEIYENNKNNITALDKTVNMTQCGNCGDFELWDGDILQIIIDSASERVKTGTQPVIVAQGVSPNFISVLPRSAKWLETWGRDQAITQPQRTGDPIKIAVFDSGLDTSLVRGYTKDFRNDCYGVVTSGWNVMAANGSFSDNSTIKHGTIVTRLIIDEIERTGTGVAPIQIVPVKVLDENGNGTLFGFLCALNYAAKSGAKIINASLGFYHYEDKIPAFEDYVDSVLAFNKIMLFAAAGNKKFNQVDFGRYQVSPQDVRNIDSNYFYPGGFSCRDARIVCITTTDNVGNAVSPQQNYSSNRVNIGVGADKGFCFKHPFKKFLFFNKYIAGSSFATPIFTGQYAGWLQRNAGNATQPRDAILTLMRSDGTVLSKTLLQQYIKDGNFVKRHY